MHTRGVRKQLFSAGVMVVMATMQMCVCVCVSKLAPTYTNTETAPASVEENVTTYLELSYDKAIPLLGMAKELKTGNQV